MRNLKLSIMSICILIFTGCSYKNTERVTVDQVLTDPNLSWIYNPDINKEAHEDCVVASKINYEDPNDLRGLLELAYVDLLNKLTNNKILNSEVTSETNTTLRANEVSNPNEEKPRTNRIQTYNKNTSMKASLHVQEAKTKYIKTYIKNVGTYNNRIAIRVCTKF